MNAIICRNCGAGLEADRIDRSLMIATCSHCGSLHDISNDSSVRATDSKETDSNTNPPKPRYEAKDVALPSRFKLHQADGGVQVTWPVGGLFHGAVLLIIAAGFAYAALTSGMIFLLGVSVALVYFAAVRSFNQHKIQVDKALLKVTQGPLPWPGTRRLNASDVEQLFTTEHESRIDKGGDNDRQIEIRKHYSLSVNTREGNRVTILRGLNDPLHALWVEQEIERSLGIKDQRVAGEHR